MRAVVLMSTYNGAAYLEPQLRSILQQDFASLSLIVRDDGSQDATPEILNRIAADDPRIEVHLDSRIGLPHAFFELLRICPDDADLYLTSDQDDIWHADKVSTVARHIDACGPATPALYCSRVRLMSDAGVVLGLSPERHSPPGFGNALIENICTGCTSGFNGALLRRIRQTRSLEGILFHDWWAYLVASAFGTVIFDPLPHVDYRLHSGNVAGMPTSRRDVLGRRLRQQPMRDRFRRLIAQAEAFDSTFRKDLDASKLVLLDKMLAMKDCRRAALGLATDRTIFRQSRRDDALWRLALGLYGAGLIDGR